MRNRLNPWGRAVYGWNVVLFLEFLEPFRIVRPVELGVYNLVNDLPPILIRELVCAGKSSPWVDGKSATSCSCPPILGQGFCRRCLQSKDDLAFISDCRRDVDKIHLDDHGISFTDYFLQGFFAQILFGYPSLVVLCEPCDAAFDSADPYIACESIAPWIFPF